jgi:hypothetical protein
MGNVQTKPSFGQFIKECSEFVSSSSRWLSSIHIFDKQLFAKTGPERGRINDIWVNDDVPSVMVMPDFLQQLYNSMLLLPCKGARRMQGNVIETI